MKSLIALYRHHIYGIMGTLVFHIMLVGVFLVAGIHNEGEIRQDALEIEFSVESANQLEELRSFLQESYGQDPNIPRSGESPFQETTNLPSNRGLVAGSDRFFDDAYEKEIATAKQLVEEVKDQLSKEITDINGIEMPEDITEGKAESEIKNIVYTGKSNIEYHLGNRHHLRLPIPVYLARGGGVVTVDIQVNQNGKVVSARARTNVLITDEQIYLYSQVAAQRTIFTADPSAPALQKGTIKYTFIPQ
jgi:hypothetical protein